jgi:hypothetical protein
MKIQNREARSYLLLGKKAGRAESGISDADMPGRSRSFADGGVSN